MGRECDHNSQPQKLLWQYGWLVFCVVVLGLFLCAVHDRQSTRKASSTVSYAYAGAEKGLTPNGLWLNVSEVRCEQVLQTALEQLDLQQQVTAAALSQCITVEPVAEKAVLDRDDFFCTDYRITLASDALSLGSRSTEEVLAEVCEAYRQFFWQSYGENLSLLEQPLELDETEPLAVQVKALELQTHRLTRYLSARQPQSSRFDPLNKKAQNLEHYVLPKVQALLSGAESAEPETIRQFAAQLEQLRAELKELDTVYQSEQQQTGLQICLTAPSVLQRIAPGRTFLELLLLFGVGCFFLRRNKKRRAGAVR